MNFYLAASFKAQKDVREYARQLEARGHRVTGQWIHAVVVDDFYSDKAAFAANMDFADIDRCDTFIVLTDPPSTTGGHFVEFGYAYGRGKLCIVIGKPLNVFHRLAQGRYETWNQFISIGAV